MTRINLISPKNLSAKHLVAEYREIMRVPGNLKKSLNRKTPFSMAEIPAQYVLGKGHVKFFYNKMEFLKKRFESLVQEMLDRNFNPNFRDSSIFDVEKKFFNDYVPSKKEVALNTKRIKERNS